MRRLPRLRPLPRLCKSGAMKDEERTSTDQGNSNGPTRYRETKASSWSEFPTWLDKLKTEREQFCKKSTGYTSALVFRGLADATWKLETTLERNYPNVLGLDDYSNAVVALKDEIETFTGRHWEIPSPPQTRIMHQCDASKWLLHGQVLDYLAHLRHHGFPSPLLDWTGSPYIAAYFALGPAAVTSRSVAIYAYLEFSSGHKVGCSDSPSILGIGSSFKTHRRHFLQQSVYTVCMERSSGKWTFASHDAAFDNVRRLDQEQDQLWCFTLPNTERSTALGDMDRFNLNAYSLLGSEEGLMETAAFRALDKLRGS